MENQSTETGRMCRMTLKDFARLVRTDQIDNFLEEFGLDGSCDIILIEKSYDPRRTKSIN